MRHRPAATDRDGAPAVSAALTIGGRVHLVGIGGAGMSAIARILLDRGLPVSGSDSRDSAVLHDLAARGARVTVGHSGQDVTGAAVVVVSSAVREDNPDVLTGRAAGLPVVHRSAALAALMAGSRAVAVTGTHGKTTTTSMITVAVRAAGVDASYAIGGDLVTDGVNARSGSGDVFVAEADESDGSFLAYRPDVLVVGNVEADHLDHYGTAEAVSAAFAALAATLRPGGTAVAGTDDAGAAAWADALATARPDVTVLRVGRDVACDVRIVDIDPGDGSPTIAGQAGTAQADTAQADTAQAGIAGTRSVARLVPGGGPGRQLRLAVPGRHNVTNAALAFTAATRGLGLPPDAVLTGLASFGGARRRFDRRGTVRGVLVVDDYAHHPTEVAAALSAAREVAGRGRVHVLFQPHLYSRTRLFAADFARALAGADTVVALDVYGAREDPEPGVHGGLVVSGLPAGRFEADRQRAVQAVTAAARAGDLVLTMGAGDVVDLVPAVLEALAAVPPVASLPRPGH